MSPPPPSNSVEALHQIDLVCDRFEAAWLAGRQPRVEEYLADATACGRAELLSALLDVQRELICREDAAPPVMMDRVSLERGRERPLVANVRLRVTAGPYLGREFQYDQHETLLAGRSAFAQLRFDDDVHFSRNHFRMEVNPPECFLIDLDSTNGTFVNGQRVRQQSLKHGDVISVGDTELTVYSDDLRATVLRATPSDDLGESGAVRPRTPHRGTRGLTTPGSPNPDSSSRLDSEPTEAAASLQLPTVSGYQIDSEVGWGDLGTTYRATRLATGEACALKILTPADRMSSRTEQAFLREAGVLNQLHHPHIVRLLDLGSANSLLYIATEFVPAVKWDAVMEQTSPATRIRVACGLICQVLDALEYAHTRSFVHRDIKPSNVLVRREGRKLVAKLSDFGLAKRYADAGLSQLTHDGDVLGSIAYMSPEQFIDSRHAKPPCDIYSTGATLYRLLTGHDPFVFTKGACKFRAILEDEPIPLQKSFPQVSDSLARIVHRSLAKHPTDRFATAAEMRHQLLPFARRKT